jgi:hypothetical protein
MLYKLALSESGCISGKFVGNLLLIREGLLSSVQNSETLKVIPAVFADCVGDSQQATVEFHGP